ncbi:MAG: hypothetical protein J6P53_06195, partial [Mailhella sp.]|nr:hypothetical protein [Mailhella sp.]
TEDDPNNYYYNEICGHLANDKIDDIMGLEHYRRTFFKDGHPMTRKDIGLSISAHGYMRFPGGYRDSMRRIYGFLDGILAKNGFPRPR